MKNYLLSVIAFFALISCNMVFAQTAPAIVWEKSYGGSGDDPESYVAPTTDGGYIISGTSESTSGDVTGTHGNGDFWIVKIDAAGTIVWEKSLGGSSYDFANFVQQTSEGGYIVAGYSFSTDGDVTVNAGVQDYWIVKLDADGNIIWQKTYGGTGKDVAQAVDQTPDGGYIVAGYSASNDGDIAGGNHGSLDYWVVRLDAAGNMIWQKSLGGTGYDDAYSVRCTSDGGYVVAGRSYSANGDITGNNGGSDYWIVKLDANGNLLWQHSLGGSAAELAYSIREIPGGDLIVAGYSTSNDKDVSGNHGSYDDWIVRLDATGNMLWQKSLGGSGDDRAYTAQITSAGGFVIAGSSTSSDGNVTLNHGNTDYWVANLDMNGSLIWQESFGGSNRDNAYSAQQTPDGGYIIGGSSISSDGDVTGHHDKSDYWIIKTDAGTTPCLAPSGTFTSNITATTANVNWSLVSGATKYKVRYKVYGNIAWTTVGTTGSFKKLKSLTPSTLYTWEVKSVCGLISSAWSVNQYFTTSAMRSSAEEEQVFTVFPNPAAGQLNISTSASSSDLTIFIYDLEGKIIQLPVTFTDQKISIDIITMTPGIYMVKVNNRITGFTSIRKFVKE